MDRLRQLCAGLPGAEEYTMVHHPAFRVRKKPFVIVGLKGDLAVNLGRMEQAELLRDPRFTRTPYIGQHGWVTLSLDGADWSEITELVTDSWRRVATKKQLQELKTDTSPPQR